MRVCVHVVCVCWGVYRVCLKQTRQWAFDWVGVSITPCCSELHHHGWFAATALQQAARTQSTSVPLSLASLDVTSVISSWHLAHWLCRCQARAVSSYCYCMCLLQTVEPSESPPCTTSAWGTGRKSHSTHSTRSKDFILLIFEKHWQMHRSQIRSLPTSNIGWF